MYLNISRNFIEYNLDPEVIVRLAEEYDQVVEVKDSGGSIGQISYLIRRTGDRISILGGTADLLLPCLLMDGKSGVVAVGNVAPRLSPLDFYALTHRNYSPLTLDLARL